MPTKEKPAQESVPLAAQHKKDSASPKCDVEITSVPPKPSPAVPTADAVAMDYDMYQEWKEEYGSNFIRLSDQDFQAALARRDQARQEFITAYINAKTRPQPVSKSRKKSSTNKDNKENEPPVVFNSREAREKVIIRATPIELDTDLMKIHSVKPEQFNFPRNKKEGNSRGSKRGRTADLDDGVVESSAKKQAVSGKAVRPKAKAAVPKYKNSTTRKSLNTRASTTKPAEAEVTITGKSVKDFFKGVPGRKGWCHCLMCKEVLWPPNETKHMVSKHPDVYATLE